MGKLNPGDPECTMAVDYADDWVRCKCGRALFWVEYVVGVINIKCPSCGTVIRLVLGVQVTKDP